METPQGCLRAELTDAEGVVLAVGLVRRLRLASGGRLPVSCEFSEIARTGLACELRAYGRDGAIAFTLPLAVRLALVAGDGLAFVSQLSMGADG